MFSREFEEARRDVWALRDAPPGADLIDEASFGDWRLAGLLWHPELGQGSDFDQCLLRRAEDIRRRLHRDGLTPISPLYVSSVCQEQCVYCNYRSGNRGVEVVRLRLSQDALEREAGFLAGEKGVRLLELVYTGDPDMTANDMARDISVVRRVLDAHGGGGVGVNGPSLSELDYRRLREAGADFAALWMETYDQGRYRRLHPGNTPKSDFGFRLDAYDRMFAAGFEWIGMGVLSGLADWRLDWAMLLRHEAALASRWGRRVAILGCPRLKPAAGALLRRSRFTPSDRQFRLALAVHSLFDPHCLPFINTRETWDLCLDLARGGGCLFTFNCATAPGGYTGAVAGAQFPSGSFDAPVARRRLKAEGFRLHSGVPFTSAFASARRP